MNETDPIVVVVVVERWAGSAHLPSAAVDDQRHDHQQRRRQPPHRRLTHRDPTNERYLFTAVSVRRDVRSSGPVQHCAFSQYHHEARSCSVRARYATY